MTVDQLSQTSDAVLNPTTPAMVEAAHDAAHLAGGRAQSAWTRLLGALASNRDIGARQAEFKAARASAVYAWSVYHSARADADHADAGVPA